MFSRFYYVNQILKMAFPIMMGNIGFILIGVGDVVVAGRHSTDTLAAISIATSVTSCIMMFGIGILSSISAILSNYKGEEKSLRRYLGYSIKFGCFLAFITSLMIFACIPLTDKIGISSNLVQMVKDYFFVTAFATYGAYLHCALKEYLQAHGRVHFSNFVTVFCVFLNLTLNILFVFGFWKVPSLGVIGLAIASLITRYFMGIVLLIYCLLKKVGSIPNKTILYKSELSYYKDLVRVGVPASFAILIEFIGFNAITVILGRVSGLYSAAHNILCTLTSVSFMVPFSFSMAASVKIGYSNGAKEYNDVKRYSWTVILMSVCFMSFSAVIVRMFPEFLTKLFTNDIELIKICIPVVSILCFFQIFDGLQVSLSGIFRGLKSTKIVMFSNFIAYWLISLPLGFYFCFKLNMYLLGFWYGIGIAAVVLCVMMFIKLIFCLKKMN